MKQYNNRIYKPVIGLEIHSELKTDTKMFCDSKNDPNESKPNSNVCPICMGHPGTLPTINKEAVKKVLLVGHAIKGKIAKYSRFDRKNYFYPDLPKGYQISQYKYPLVGGGELNGIRITRIHLEEDTGRLVHSSDHSLVDFNRAGVPLMELVTEPDITSGKEARKFAEELRLILRYLDASEADMEKGQLRIEANISVNKEGEKLGTKVEVKNLNSFRAVEGAINFEIKRQTELLEKGKQIVQETRGWNESKQLTFSQRIKEESHDYRYLPEPDLPPLDLETGDFGVENIGVGFPKLPQEIRKELKEKFDLNEEQTEILIRDKKSVDYFNKVINSLGSPASKLVKLAVNYLTSDLQSILKETEDAKSLDELKITPDNFAQLISFLYEQKITSRIAKDVLKIMSETGKNPVDIIKEQGLSQTDDESVIVELVDKIIVENPGVVKDYKEGKESSIQFFIGQGMKATKGSVNPIIFKEILRKRLN